MRNHSRWVALGAISGLCLLLVSCSESNLESVPEVPVDQIGYTLGGASFKIDDRGPPPTPDSTELFVQVWEVACNDGQHPGDRLQEPVVEITDDAVSILFSVESLPPDEFRTCPMPLPGQSETVDLGQPLGERVVLDASFEPPQQVWPQP